MLSASFWALVVLDLIGGGALAVADSGRQGKADRV
jgi:hypothetical protein